MRPLLVLLPLAVALFSAGPPCHADPPLALFVDRGRESIVEARLTITDIAHAIDGRLPFKPKYQVSVRVTKHDVTTWEPVGELTEDEYIELQTIRARLPENLEREYAAHRGTGGFSACHIVGQVIELRSAADPKVRRRTGVHVKFADFERENGSHGDPKRVDGRFVETDYFKALYIDEWRDAGNAKVAVVKRKGGKTAPYELKPFALPKLEGPPERQQVFVDFGKHPLFPAVANDQVLYRCFLIRLEGTHAVIVRSDDLKKLQDAVPGTRMGVRYYVVPKSVLRLAPEGRAGTEFLARLDSDFERDLATPVVAAAEGEAPPKWRGVDDLFRANLLRAGSVKAFVGKNVEASLVSVAEGYRAARASGAGNVRPWLRPVGAEPVGIAPDPPSSDHADVSAGWGRRFLGACFRWFPPFGGH